MTGIINAVYRRLAKVIGAVPFPKVNEVIERQKILDTPALVVFRRFTAVADGVQNLTHTVRQIILHALQVAPTVVRVLLVHVAH